MSSYREAPHAHCTCTSMNSFLLVSTFPLPLPGVVWYFIFCRYAPSLNKSIIHVYSIPCPVHMSVLVVFCCLCTSPLACPLLRLCPCPCLRQCSCPFLCMSMTKSMSMHCTCPTPCQSLLYVHVWVHNQVYCNCHAHESCSRVFVQVRIHVLVHAHLNVFINVYVHGKCSGACTYKCSC
jgi:hypothetical protein